MTRSAFTWFFTLPILLLFTAFVPYANAETDWPQWRGPLGNGVAAGEVDLIERLPEEGLKPEWIVSDLPNLKGGGWSSPVVADGRVYLFTHKRFGRQGAGRLGRAKYPYLPPEKRTGMSDEEYAEYEQKRRDEQEARAKAYRFDESLYCLDAATGETLWVNTRNSVYTRFSQSGTPTVREDGVYILGAGRVARKIDLKGKDVWTTELEGEFRDEFLQSSFAVANGVAVVKCGALFALDAQSGKVLWQAGENRNGAPHSSPIIHQQGDQALAIANLDGKDTVAFRLRSGEEVWRVRSEAGNSTPLVVEDKLLTYGSSRKRGLRCFDLTENPPQLLWTFQGAADPGSSPVVVDEVVYVQGDRRLAAVELDSGDAKWQAQLDLNRPRYTSLIAADGKVFYGFDGLLCFEAGTRRFRPLMQGVVNREGLLADEEAFRKMLKIDELERTAEGQREAEVLWRKEIGRNGPLPCSTPAIANGRLFVRLQGALACYDLRAKP